MNTELFQSELWLARPIDEVFGFFSDARNLQTITPPWLDFQILTPGAIEVRAGLLIDYRLRVHGFPLRWQSEITAWDPPHYFVDEQRRGPYRLWVHEHRFRRSENGTVVSDEVRYAVPGGALVNRLFVRRDIERIFAFRRQKLLERFTGTPESLSGLPHKPA